MKRYQVQDPTGQGFYQVVDTGAWKPVRIWKLWPFPRFRKSHIGNTYLMASFTAYCPEAKRQAEDLAEWLNSRENFSPGMDCGWRDQYVMYVLPETTAGRLRKREISIAMISGKWCPDSRERARIIAGRLSEGWPGTFTVEQIERGDE